MHLNGQADCLRLSVAKPNQWINDEWRANRKPRRGRAGPFPNGFRRARMLKLDKNCWRHNDLSEKCRKNVNVADEDQVVYR